MQTAQDLVKRLRDLADTIDSGKSVAQAIDELDDLIFDYDENWEDDEEDDD